MRTEPINLVVFRIYDAPRLDPITVALEDLAPGIGRLIVECYGQAWAGYWGATGERTIAQFVTTCEADYIASRMCGGQVLETTEYNYLRHIVEAVQEALKQRAKGVPST